MVLADFHNTPTIANAELPYDAPQKQTWEERRTWVLGGCSGQLLHMSAYIPEKIRKRPTKVPRTGIQSKIYGLLRPRWGAAFEPASWNNVGICLALDNPANAHCYTSLEKRIRQVFRHSSRCQSGYVKGNLPKLWFSKVYSFLFFKLLRYVTRCKLVLEDLADESKFFSFLCFGGIHCTFIFPDVISSQLWCEDEVSWGLSPRDEVKSRTQGHRAALRVCVYTV